MAIKLTFKNMSLAFLIDIFLFTRQNIKGSQHFKTLYTIFYWDRPEMLNITLSKLFV